MSDQTPDTMEKERALNRTIPITLNFNLDEVNGLLHAMGQAKLEVMFPWFMAVREQAGKQVSDWQQAQQAAPTDVEVKTPEA